MNSKFPIWRLFLLLAAFTSDLPPLAGVAAKRPNANVGIYYDNGFDQTVPLVNIKKRDRKRIEDNVLNVLGFNEAPEMLHHPPLYSERHDSNVEFLVEAYNTIQNLDQRTRRNLRSSGRIWRKLLQADAVFSVRSQSRKANVSYESEGEKEERVVMFFDVSNLTIPVDQQIRTAEIRVFLRPSNNTSPLVSVTVHRVTASNILEPIYYHEPTVSTGWIDFDISNTIVDWHTNSSTNYGVVITAQTQNGEEVDASDIGFVTDIGSVVDRKVGPFLLVFTQAAASSSSQRLHLERRRRNADTQQIADQTAMQSRPAYNNLRQAATNGCKMRNLRVDFEKLGWSNWIVAPNSYNANFCAGSCSYPHNQNTATNHAIVQTLLHVTYQKVYPLPSCAPDELDDTSILYRDSRGGVVMKKYKQMVVKTCSCQ